MQREEFIKIAGELLEIMNEKRISPSEAEIIAEILLKAVNDSNIEAKESLMNNGTFRGLPPKS